MKVYVTSAWLAACLSLCAAVMPAYAQDGKVASTSSSEAKASMEAMQIPSHGSAMNALVYVAAGAGPHPVVVLLHGFPGNERNLDLAQDMRRAGWDVLYFNYRGAWGTPGDFSFSHAIEDVAAALAYLRAPENAKRLRLDPSRIVLVGHSMGGMMAVQAAAADPAVKGIAMISAADMAGRAGALQEHDSPANAIRKTASALAAEGLAPLSGCTPEGLAQELSDHAAAWAFPSKAGAVKDRPVLVVTSDDGLGPANHAFINALRRAGNVQVMALYLRTDHSYSDKRVQLSHSLLEWLARFR